MNRGRRGGSTFSDKSDYDTVLALLRESSDMWNAKVVAYCLTPNYYHILAHTPAANLSRFMRHLNDVYTHRFNRSHDCDGFIQKPFDVKHLSSKLREILSQ